MASDRLLTGRACARCGEGSARRYLLALSHADEDYLEDGQHVADVEIVLCGKCSEDVADMLIDFLATIHGVVDRFALDVIAQQAGVN